MESPSFTVQNEIVHDASEPDVNNLCPKFECKECNHTFDKIKRSKQYIQRLSTVINVLKPLIKNGNTILNCIQVKNF